MQNVLENIREGMKVYDSRQKEIGKVEWVKLVDEDPVTGEPVEAGLDAEPDRHSLIDDLADAFRDDDLPDVVRSRLLHDGFVRMDAEGLFNADRYVLPDQIASVSGDKVLLKVTKDELVKWH
jgi:hypothetical protein